MTTAEITHLNTMFSLCLNYEGPLLFCCDSLENQGVVHGMSRVSLKLSFYHLTVILQLNKVPGSAFSRLLHIVMVSGGFMHSRISPWCSLMSDHHSLLPTPKVDMTATFTCGCHVLTSILCRVLLYLVVLALYFYHNLYFFLEA